MKKIRLNTLTFYHEELLMKKIALFVLLILVFGQTQAQAYEWKLDQAHSNFYFDVKHIFSTIRGQFMEFSGNVVFDPAKLNMSKFDFVIKVDSINTNIGKRDTHLRSDDFFSAAKYPEIRFTSSKVTLAGGNKYLVNGRLTIKDVSKDITLEFIYLGEKENPLKPGAMIAGLDARTSIDCLAYNVSDGKFYKMGVVGKDVDILVSLELQRDK